MVVGLLHMDTRKMSPCGLYLSESSARLGASAGQWLVRQNGHGEEENKQQLMFAVYLTIFLSHI